MYRVREGGRGSYDPCMAKASGKARAAPRGAGPRTGRSGSGERDRAAGLLKALDRHYPGASCALHFSSPHELLVATILSAQATDVSVNRATPALFARFPTPGDYARATPGEIEPYVRSIGLYRNKSRAIHESMRAVVERFGGRVPGTMEELLTLRGVARKTANVVLSNAFARHEGVVVDTHVQRLATRFGLVEPGASPRAIERRLMELFPRERWGDLSHMLIAHGRGACKARSSSCADHPICREFGVACPLDAARGARVTSRRAGRG